MIIDVDEKWSADFIQWVVRAVESSNVEFKRVSGKMVAKALETICAFANTGGGWLVLGVEDAGQSSGMARLVGIQENPEAVDELLRKLASQIVPALGDVRVFKVPCTLRDGTPGHLIAVYVFPSDKVHSIVDGGTWTRGEASNRVLNAAEITELSYRRGVRTAEAEPVDIDFDLLNGDSWRLFLQGRGLSVGPIDEQLYRIGLARKVDGKLQPLRAAVLLFADEPGSLLAASGTRADIRVFHYRGNAIEAGEVPNLKKTPKTISGPLYRQIAQAHAYLLDELSEGLMLAASGFRTKHQYPERVIKEAITNAVIHRDYRMNRDIHIRIFDNRIEVHSPGLLPGRVTPATIHQRGSFARNSLIAMNLREFPEPPNVDAGEGVRMMFNVMQESNLFEPIYRELRDQAQEAVAVTLLNNERPTIWVQVSDWIDRHGAISNSELCHIASLDTLKASKLLKKWVEQGVLLPDASRAKRNMIYRKPMSNGTEGAERFIIQSKG
ncbi:MAG: ATP-binding protein [Rugosibacter sp.]|jgi:ATP-dependent DNA helicase RecG|nr:ATP-binding protein [Rugosibacter sp.]